MTRAQVPHRHPDGLLLAVLAVCLGAVGTALISQHRFGMEPCPWCVLQRLIFVAMALVCLLGLAWRRRAGAVASGLLVLGLAASGVAAAMWQHFVAAATASCNLTLADRVVGASRLDVLLPDVFSARASCADAAVDLAGMPYEFWSLLLYLFIGAAALRLVRAGR